MTRKENVLRKSVEGRSLCRGPQHQTVETCYDRRSGECQSGIFEPSVAQPPLPLHEFLPLQPLSLDLHPPSPLHEFCPLQECFSFFAVDGLSVSSGAYMDGAAPGSKLEACTMDAPLPASNPASAAPAINAFLDFVIVA